VSLPALLDVNLLIALFDPDHVHHEPAHVWFGAHKKGGWATCPLTENGLVRILSNPAYSPAAERPARIAERLRVFCGSGHHVFWPDDVSLRDAGRFDLAVSHRRLTDVYLLALAVAHEGRLATFDRSIPSKGVPGAGPRHLAVIEA
jgi:toxin-antitoxin system PIN domain toxin